MRSVTTSGFWVLAAALLLAGCSKPSAPPPEGSPAPTGSARTSVAVEAGAAAAQSLAGSTWVGRYTAAPGSLYVPEGPEWQNVRFRGEDASVGLGEGDMTVAIDSAGRASGSVEGPLGPMHVDGVMTLEPADASTPAFEASLFPGDSGASFSGTVVGERTGDRVAGTLRVSLPTANVVREARFTLERKR
jgi:hypothetical protein